MLDFSISPGRPTPLGPSCQQDGINFAVVSSHATRVVLCLFRDQHATSTEEIELDPVKNRTGNVWHVLVHTLAKEIIYGFRVATKRHPNLADAPILLDPYAKNVLSHHPWGSSSNYKPLGAIVSGGDFSWEEDKPPNIPFEDLLIYEMHVRGFTQHPSSKVAHPGTFHGIAEKGEYLKWLGVNAIELLPIQEFYEGEVNRFHPHTQQPLYNYWGYSSVNFFAPMNRYASHPALGAAAKEFRIMVKEMHRHGIEVILDIVLNHTAEGDEEGPTYSFRGFGPEFYYILDASGRYFNFSGCGNTFSANHPVVQEFLLDVLRYWVVEMHVDGFRFDLASALVRGVDGMPHTHSPFIERISHDPILANTKLIAEPWDAGGLYQVGQFAPHTGRWAEWNGKYRDTVRRFIKGTDKQREELATRLCGSEDLYGNHRKPYHSINFVIAHDGFTLRDLVSYNHKHNLENGEKHHDGCDHNESWNCGAEGPTQNPKVIALRERQKRNFHLMLMASQGVPMLHMGDEYGHTKHGNNNSWCHDSEVNWFLWDQLEADADFLRFYRLLIHFRKQHQVLRRKTFLKPQDIEWHGCKPFQPDWKKDNRFIAFTLKDHEKGENLYLAFNAYHHAHLVVVPKPSEKHAWHWIVNTAETPPNDFLEEGQTTPILGDHYKMLPHSALLLKALHC